MAMHKELTTIEVKMDSLSDEGGFDPRKVAMVFSVLEGNHEEYDDAQEE